MKYISKIDDKRKNFEDAQNKLKELEDLEATMILKLNNTISR